MKNTAVLRLFLHVIVFVLLFDANDAMAMIVNGCSNKGLTLHNAAPLPSNADFSDMFARTNSIYLAKKTVRAFCQMLRQEGVDNNNVDHNHYHRVLRKFLNQIQNKKHNMDKGFYPFVLRYNATNTVKATLAAHGKNHSLKGLTIDQVFDSIGIGFTNTEHFLRRLLTAAEKGGDFVQYLWSGRVADSSQQEGRIVINSKWTYVLELAPGYLVGVGYESTELPIDLPCSARFDGWCSINNMRALVGKALFRLTQAASLENLEVVFRDLSFDPEFSIADPNMCGGSSECRHYVFIYSYDGRLKAHALLHEYFNKTLPEILQGQGLGNWTEGLHELFVTTADSQAEGLGNGFVQYKWRNSKTAKPYVKIAYVTKFEFDGDYYYLGSGFGHEMDFDSPDSHSGTLTRIPDNSRWYAPEGCDLLCYIKRILKLSSHAISLAISSPLQHTVNEITHNDNFRWKDSLYVFIYSTNGICRAHGWNPDFVGWHLSDVFRYLGIDIDATLLNERFVNASAKFGVVDYKWIDPQTNEEFVKISYLFQFSLDGEQFYAGLGFNNITRSYQQQDSDGPRMNANNETILCSYRYAMNCSQVNSKAVIARVFADLTHAESFGNDPQTVWDAINAGQRDYLINKDFAVMVFAIDDDVNSVCKEPDGSGCCIAENGHLTDRQDIFGGDESLVGMTWEQICKHLGIESISGGDLHKGLVDSSTLGSDGTLKFGEWRYEWNRGEGDEARQVIAKVVMATHGGKRYYILSQYINTTMPPTCEKCPPGYVCNDTFCEKRPIRVSLMVAAFGLLLAVLLFQKDIALLLLLVFSTTKRDSSLRFVLRWILKIFKARQVHNGDRPAHLAYDVFIAHSGGLLLRNSIDALREQLEEQDLNVFIDHAMRPNHRPYPTMKMALANCCHIVVIVSRRFVTRQDPCSELRYAFDKFEWLCCEESNYWHCLHVVLFDLSVEEYKMARTASGNRLPDLSKHVQLKVYNQEGRGEWDGVCKEVIASIHEEDRDIPWNAISSVGGSSALWSNPFGGRKFPSSDNVYNLPREQTGAVPAHILN